MTKLRRSARAPSSLSGPLLLLLLSGCQHSLPGYLIEQGFQQGALYMKAIPVDEALRSDDLSASDRGNLLLAQEALQFSRDQLGLKTKGNYEKYLKLDRSWVTQVVVASKKNQVEAHMFKYPLFGALPYRGYFNAEKASDYAKHIAQKHDLDTIVRPVPAYSTTGWLRDPLISTMFRSPGDLAELIFHELVHLQFYFDGQADFNEAFATWYAEKALNRFLKAGPKNIVDPQRAMAKAVADTKFQLAYAELISEQLKRAEAFYKGGKRSEAERRDFFEEFRKKLLALDPKRKWPAYPELNNAYLISSSTYYLLLPKIESLATQMQFDEKQMLELVLKTGPSIVATISNRKI